MYLKFSTNAVLYFPSDNTFSLEYNYTDFNPHILCGQCLPLSILLFKIINDFAYNVEQQKFKFLKEFLILHKKKQKVI